MSMERYDIIREASSRERERMVERERERRRDH